MFHGEHLDELDQHDQRTKANIFHRWWHKFIGFLRRRSSRYQRAASLLDKLRGSGASWREIQIRTGRTRTRIASVFTLASAFLLQRKFTLARTDRVHARNALVACSTITRLRTAVYVQQYTRGRAAGPRDLGDLCVSTPWPRQNPFPEMKYVRRDRLAG